MIWFFLQRESTCSSLIYTTPSCWRPQTSVQLNSPPSWCTTDKWVRGKALSNLGYWMLNRIPFPDYWFQGNKDCRDSLLHMIPDGFSYDPLTEDMPVTSWKSDKWDKKQKSATKILFTILWTIFLFGPESVSRRTATLRSRRGATAGRQWGPSWSCPVRKSIPWVGTQLMWQPTLSRKGCHYSHDSGKPITGPGIMLLPRSQVDEWKLQMFHTHVVKNNFVF